jgi:hypothetical protein
MLKMRTWFWGVALGALVATAAAQPVANVDTNADILVNVDRRGPLIVVDVQAPIAASASEAWSVLTDYEHMAAFVSNLKSSAVLQRDGHTLTVEQIGEAKRGPIKYPFQTVRKIELTPTREIRSTLVSGAFKSYFFSTRIVDNGASVVVFNHGEYEPTTWVPPIIGPALIETETRKQFGELRDEVMRRKRGLASTR